MKTFRQLFEDIHPKIIGALDAAPNFAAVGALHGAKRRIRGEAARKGLQPNTGIETKSPSRGTAREYFRLTRQHHMKLDNENVSIPAGLKVARPGWQDGDTSPERKISGQVQNSVEAHPKTQQHSVIRKNPDGSWSSNPRGVVLPVLHIGPNKKYIHVGHAQDLPTDSRSVRQLTKSESHPRGLNYNQLEYAIAGQGYHDHPIAKKFAYFRKKTGIGDIHPKNLGVWRHPISGERHIVLRDAGYNSETEKIYHGDVAGSGLGSAEVNRREKKDNETQNFLSQTKQRPLRKPKPSSVEPVAKPSSAKPGLTSRIKSWLGRIK